LSPSSRPPALWFVFLLLTPVSFPAFSASPETVVSDAVPSSSALKPDSLTNLDSNSNPDLNSNERVSPQEVQRLIDEGKAFFRKSAFDLAQENFDRVIRLNPKNSQGYYWRGQILIKQGDVEQGLLDIERSAELSPDNTKLWQALAQAYNESGKKNLAEATYLKAINIDPNNMGARLQLGMLLQRQKRIDAAIDVFESIFDQDPKSRQAGIAFEHLKTLYQVWVGVLEERLKSEKLDLDEIAQEKLVNRGKRLYQLGAVDLAIQLLDALIIVLPNNSQAHYWSSQALLQKKRPDEAIQHIEKSVSLSPDNLFLKRQLGEAYQRVGKEELAEQVYIDILDRSPDFDKADQLKLEIGLIRARRFEKAQDYAQLDQVYVELLKEFPGDIKIMILRANAFEKRGETQAADKIFVDVIELEPTNLKLRMGLIDLYEKRGEVELARQESSKLLELTTFGGPEHIFALERLGLREGQEKIKAKQFQQAVDVLKSLNEQSPGELLVVYHLGVAYQGLQQLDEAKKLFEEAIEIEPKMANPHLLLGLMYLDENKFTEAIDHLELAQLHGGEIAVGKEAEKQLLRLEKQIIALGKDKLRQGELEEAETLFQRLVKRSPDNAQGNFWLGKVLIKRKKVEEGLSGIERSVALAPNSWQARESLAQSYEEAELYEKALKTYQAAYEMAPNQNALLLKIALMFRLLKDEVNFQESFHNYFEFLQEDALRLEALNAIGFDDAKEQLKAKKYDQAITGLIEILTVAPDEPLVLARLGEAYYGAGLLDDAQRSYQKALKLSASDVVLQLEVGLFFQATGSFDEAAPLLSQVVKRGGGETRKQALVALNELLDDKADQLLLQVSQKPVMTDEDVRKILKEGQSMIKHRGHRQVIKVYSAMAKKNKNNSQIYYWLGQAYFKAGDNAKGVKNIEKSVRLSPENIALKIELGKAYHNSKMDQDAIQIYEEIIEKQPDRAEVLIRLARLYQAVGEADLAKQYVKRIQAVADNAALKRKALDVIGMAGVIAAFKKKEYEVAEKALAEIAITAPDHPTVVRYSGLVKLGIGKNAEAERFFKRLTKLSPNDYTGYKMLADIYIADGRDDEAIIIFEQAKKHVRAGHVSANVLENLSSLYVSSSKSFIEEMRGKSLTDQSVIDLGVSKGRNLVKIGKLGLAEKVLDVVLRGAENDPQANYWHGVVAMRLGKVDEGLRQIKRSTELMPDNKRLVWELGKAYQQAGRLDDALTTFALVSGDIKDARRRMFIVRALKYKKQGEPARAIEEYQALLAENPDDSKALLLVASTYEEMGELALADVWYLKAQKQKPDDIGLRKKLVKVYEQRGDKEQVDEQLKAIIARVPSGVDRKFALDKLGLAEGQRLLVAKEYAAAIQQFNNVLLVEPENESAQIGIANVYFSQNELVLAEKLYLKILKINPKSAKSFYGLGAVYRAQGKPEKAISSYEKSLALSGSSALGGIVKDKLVRLISLKAEALIKKGKSEEAIEELKRVIKLSPGDVSSHFNLAILYGRQKKLDLAIEELEMVVKLDNTNIKAYSMLVFMYDQKQQLDKTIEAKAHVVSLEKDQEKIPALVEELSIYLVRKLFNDGDLLLAFQELDRIRIESPESTQANYYLALLYARVGNMDSAVQAYESVLRQNPSNHRVRFSLAVMYERKNEDELALEQYQKILASGKADQTVERARLRIEAVKDRTRRLSSRLDYRLIKNKSDTEVSNSDSFSSSLNISLNMAYKPIKSTTLNGTVGAAYTGNHDSGGDSFSPRTGASAIMNFENGSISSGTTFSRSTNLLLDDLNGESVNYYLRGLVRFDDPLDLVNLFEGEEDKPPVHGVSNIIRPLKDAPPAEEEEQRKPLDLTDNQQLRDLLEALQKEIDEETRRHVVKKGDTLWDISALLLDDPWLWPEIWHANPKIENPHLIFPGDVISLVYINGQPRLLLQRDGLEVEFLTVDEGMRLYQEAVQHIADGQYAEALPKLMRILEFIPSDVFTNLNVAMAYQGLGAYVEAEKYYRIVLELDKNLHEAWFMLAEMFEEMGSFDKAIEEFELMVRTLSGTIYARDAQKKLLALYRSSALKQVAILIADDSGVIDNDRIERVVADGRGLIEQGDLEGARKVFEALVKWRPEIADAQYWLARVEIEQGNFDAAIEHLSISVALKPENQIYRGELAELYVFTGQADLAFEQFQMIAEFSNDAVQARWAAKQLTLMQVQQFQQSENYQAALTLLLDMAMDYVGDSVVMLKIADLYWLMADYVKAEAAYLELLEVNEGHAEAHMQLLRMLDSIDEQDKLAIQIAAFIEAGLSEEYRYEIRSLLGFHEALDLMPQGLFEEALTLLKEIERLLPDDALVKLNIAIAHQFLGNVGTAETMMKDIIEKDPDNLTARLRLGQLYAENKRIDEAIAVFRDLIIRGKGTSIIAEVLPLLEELRKRQEQQFIELEAGEPVPKSLQLSLSSNDFDPSGLNYSNAKSLSLALRFSYPAGDWGNWALNYERRDNINEHRWGADYAYISDGLTLSVGRPLFASKIRGLYGTASVSHIRTNYSNLDSNAFYALGLSQKRMNVTNNIALSLNYRIHNQLSFSLNINAGRNESNLPIGLSYAPEFALPVSRQGGSLPSYSNLSISTGMQFRF